MTLAALIAYGKLCRGCGKQCQNDDGISIECPSCKGYGCDKCKDGLLEINGCPSQLCASVVPVVDLINLFDKGLSPIQGGMLDQSQSFIEAAKFYALAGAKAQRDE